MDPTPLNKKDLMTLDWWTLRECANRWRVSITTVTRWLEKGDLLGRKFGNQWRVCTAAVHEFEKAGVPQVRRAEPKPDLSQFKNATEWV